MQPELIYPDRMVGYNCPCCGRFSKVYRRTFNANMSVAILLLYRLRDKGFIHVENTLSEFGYKRCGDFTYLKWYGLIDPLLEERTDGSKRNGYYRITGRGIMFCEQALTVKEKFLMDNGKCIGFDGKDITIKDALGTRFDYQKLMQNI